jgi:hypothetical protein
MDRRATTCAIHRERQTRGAAICREQPTADIQQTSRRLFDDFIRALLELFGHVKTERLRRRQVDD